jgi:hypothetical protein
MWIGFIRSEAVCQADTMDQCAHELHRIGNERGVKRSLDFCMTMGSAPRTLRPYEEREKDNEDARNVSV